MNIQEYYSSKKASYDIFTSELVRLIQSLLNDKNIVVHSVSGRAKSIESYLEKAKKYKKPEKEITDYIGLRVITYVNSDIEKICSVIEEQFEVDKNRSINKTKKLKPDQVGYRSIHYILKINSQRRKLPEYNKMKDICFEIQVRTLLEHTWAEIEHDRSYKFHGILPENIKRRLNLLSAVLEIADNEFNSIANDIDSYVMKINTAFETNNLTIELTSASICELFIRKTKVDSSRLINNYLNTIDEVIINELFDFGINNIEQLNNIFNTKYFDKINISDEKNISVAGILRDLMMLSDCEKYFTSSWKKHWHGIDSKTISILEGFDVRIMQYVHRFGLDIIDEDFA